MVLITRGLEDKMKILVTGGAGFIGSHIAEYYAKKENSVVVFDNLSREKTSTYNWNYLKKNYKNIQLVKGDIRNFHEIINVVRCVDAIFHTAAQVAVIASVKDPQTDFDVNAIGTFNVLEAARNSKNDPAIIYCSTNKVYGENVNKIPIKEKKSRYVFDNKNFRNEISESFSIDLCEHTPYGCSKLTGDLYVQDYGKLYGLKTGIFRMSCIYGTRQFGTEDQGWVAYFTISTLKGNPLTIYGDGKQVRDVLYISDLLDAYNKFLENGHRLKGEVFNMGGGPKNTLSLIELLDILEKKTGKRSKLSFEDWRPSDQKVYISDISKAQEKLKWSPKISPEEGIDSLIKWFGNIDL